jgi:AcrR family transcriptional regulator
MAKRKIGRDELIERAGYLFRTRGYAHTSIADIADYCGLSKASLYHHISSKQELATKVIEQLYAYFKDNIFNRAYDDSLPTMERAKNLLNEIKQFFNNREGGCLMGNLIGELIDTHPEFREMFANFFNEWTAAFEHVFIEKYSQQVAHVIALDIVAQLQGAILMARLYKSNEPVERTIHAALTLLEHPVANYISLAGVSAAAMSNAV